MLPERFWNKVNKNGPVSEHRPDLGPCWLWTGSRTRNGYGQWNRGNGRRVPFLVHKSAYEDIYGPLSPKLRHDLDHLCRVRHCCNPAHLEPVTRRENIMRGVRPNLTKTHCPREHEYDAQNTYTQRNKSGTTSRKCRICMANAVLRHRGAA